MADVVRLGIVGTGKRGKAVGAEFKALPGCRITALMDRYPACVQSAAEALKLPDAMQFTDYGRFLREAPVDAVLLACSPMEQADMACDAMQRGLHVCTEVPMAFSLAELNKLIAAVERSGCKYQLMEQMRYAGFLDTWKGMVQRGELGHICQAQGEYIHFRRNWGYFTDLDTGEILHDLEPPAGRRVEKTWRYHILGEPILYLPHTLSPMLKVLDDRVTRVSCMGTRKRSYTYPDANLEWHDVQYALMHTAKDTVLLAGAGFSLIHVARGACGGAHWFEFRGSRGSVESPRHVGAGFHVYRGDPEQYKEKGAHYDIVELSEVPLIASEEQKRSGHGGKDFRPPMTFIDAIQRDTQPPVDVYVSAQFTAPAIMAAQSARQGGVMLEVPDYSRPQSGQSA